MKAILVTGARGQIGAELTSALRERYGAETVIATDVRMPPQGDVEGQFQLMDCLDPNHITRVMQRFNVGTIYHLAAILSAVGEAKPSQAWRINVDGLYHMLEAARQYGCRLFFPSSIGAFGASTPKLNTPQVTVQRPTTMYGVTKVTGELLCDYYMARFGVDTRGLRFPGLISYKTEPGGGTTDYAVDVFHYAVEHKRYTCYLREDTALDMMYMPDAVRAMIELMEADGSRLKHRNAYNLSAMSFSPAQLAAEIQTHVPAFEVTYRVDPVRQAIADSWPDHLDDSAARSEWGWAHRYGLEEMVSEMLQKVAEKHVDGSVRHLTR